MKLHPVCLAGLLALTSPEFLIAAPDDGGPLTAEVVASGLRRPIFACSPPGDTDRIFIVGQRDSNSNSGTNHIDSAKIQIYKKSTGLVNATPFLTIAVAGSHNERGLLGLAFHPDYATNGFLYVNFNATTTGTTVIRRYTVSDKEPGGTDNPDIADDTTGLDIISYTQPSGNHNAGWIGFNPVATDTTTNLNNPKYFLYIASGDGGGGDDNDGGHTALIGNGQDTTDNLLGKILRVDVGMDGLADAFGGDPTKNYTIPTSNPFASSAGDDEIWAYGLRNPWRCSFDRATGDLWIADVGQNNREEINFYPSGGTAVQNYGWRLREGDIATPTPAGSPVGGAAPADHIPPVFVYENDNAIVPLLNPPLTSSGGTVLGRSVTGGYVYRGPSMPWLQGTYFFADARSNRAFSLRYNSGTTTVSELAERTASISGAEITSFGEDGAGEIYFTCCDQNNGSTGQLVKITQDPYYLWRNENFSVAEIIDDAISGITADSDQDGKSTIEEFVGNTNPTAPDAPLPATTTVDPDGGSDEFLTMTLTIDPDAADSVDIVGETSPDLTIGNFSAATATTTVSGGSAIARDLVPLSTINSKRFGRFKFELK